MHKFARRAAIASMAAHEQGKFWQYNDKLYESFRQLNEQKFQEIAKEVGLDMRKFSESMQNPGIVEKVNMDLQDGSAAGVRGTPTVFINGRLLKSRGLKGFQVLIEKELKKMGTKK